jgi:hypothetical protein
MNARHMGVIQVPPAVPLHEGNISPVIHSPINQDQPTLRVVLTEP